MHTRCAFSLVELLVAISIIVVLLAMLVPSMDRAMYQAELAVCGARLRAAGNSITQYTMGNQRVYPVRKGPEDLNNLGWRPNQLKDKTVDDRPSIFAAVLPEMLLDPFCSEIDLTTESTTGLYYSNYDLWFAFRFDKAVDGETMDRIGDALVYDGVRYPILAADSDRLFTSSDQANHPDDKNVLLKSLGYQDGVNIVPGWNAQGSTVTFSNWTTGAQGARLRGLLDLNHAFDDGSVRRVTGVEQDDERMGQLPDHSLANPNEVVQRTKYVQLPR